MIAVLKKKTPPALFHHPNNHDPALLLTQVSPLWPAWPDPCSPRCSHRTCRWHRPLHRAGSED